MPVIHGEKSYLVLASETTWASVPASPVYYHVPVNSYSVEMKRDRRNTRGFTGLRQRKHGRSYRGMIVGGMSCNLCGYKPDSNAMSLAEYLVTWGFTEPETVDLASKLADWAEGPNVSNVRHKGLRVNSATLEGSADSGVITLNMELMGHSEIALATAQTLSNDREKLVEMDFQDCTFTLGGSTIQLRSFTYQVQNNLSPTYLNSTAPSYLAAGERVESLKLQFMKTGDTYAALNRAFVEDETTAVIVIKGLHNGTGSSNYTVGTITFNRLAFVGKDDSRDITKLMENGITYDVLKPDSADNAVSIAWTEAV